MRTSRYKKKKTGAACLQAASVFCIWTAFVDHVIEYAFADSGRLTDGMSHNTEDGMSYSPGYVHCVMRRFSTAVLLWYLSIFLPSGGSGSAALFSKPVCLRRDGLRDVVICQSGLADDGKLHSGNAVKRTERSGDGLHRACRLPRGGITTHEVV